jgi:hypothetical protein
MEIPIQFLWMDLETGPSNLVAPLATSPKIGGGAVEGVFVLLFTILINVQQNMPARNEPMISTGERSSRLRALFA